MRTAPRDLICGASGISGFQCTRALFDSPARWSRVYALSRRPSSDSMLSLLSSAQREKVTHVSVDLLSSAEDVAEALRSAQVKAD